MKWIKYDIECGDMTCTKSIPLNDENLKIAEEEAPEGKYEIIDDGKTPEPTAEERLAALETAFLEMLGVVSNG